MIDHTMTKFQSDLFSAGFWELSDEMRTGFYAAMLDATRVLVTAKRGKHADEKWQRIKIEEHLDHAWVHSHIAWCTANGDILGKITEDRSPIDDDGLPHAAHAVARIACAYGRGILIGKPIEGEQCNSK